MKNKTITFLPANKACTFNGQPSILEVAMANEVHLNHSCGGMGSCTTCRVCIKEGLEKLDSPNEVEAEHRQMRAWKASERLSCQTLAQDGVVVLIPHPMDVD